METVFFIIAIILFFVGLLGLVVPILPDLLLIWSGVLLYALVTRFAEVPLIAVIALGILSLSTFVVDYLTTTFGAKRYGASRWGIIGGVIGGILGLFMFPPFGFLSGFIAGAIGAEGLVARRSFDSSVKTAKGVLLGFLFGFVIKAILAGVIIGTFLVLVF
jgi:uncharacterized protein YqgC (DUF456 family)